MKNKDRRKMWEKEEEDVGAAGVFSEEGFLVFFWFVFGGVGRVFSES